MIFLLNSRFLFFFPVVHEENQTQKISSNKNWCTWLYRSEFFSPKIIFTFHFIYQRKINCSETKLLFYADFLFLSSHSGDWTTFVASAALLLMSQSKIKQEQIIKNEIGRRQRERQTRETARSNTSNATEFLLRAYPKQRNRDVCWETALVWLFSFFPSSPAREKISYV